LAIRNAILPKDDAQAKYWYARATDGAVDDLWPWLRPHVAARHAARLS
jgi:hypothetical protein